MTREVLNRLARAAEHYGEKNPNLAALLREAFSLIERDRLIEVLKAERDILNRECQALEFWVDGARMEIDSIEKAIHELESMYANRNEDPSDA